MILAIYIPYLVHIALGVRGVRDEAPGAEERAEEGEADDVGAAPLLGGAAVEVGLVRVSHAVVGLLVAAPLATAVRAGTAALYRVKRQGSENLPLTLVWEVLPSCLGRS